MKRGCRKSGYAQDTVATLEHDEAAAVACPRTRDHDMVAVDCVIGRSHAAHTLHNAESHVSIAPDDSATELGHSHQTSLNSEKYASWYLFVADSTASGSPYPGRGQNPAGIHGKGLVQTSSPASSGAAAVPVGTNASMAIPRSRHWISPRKTGSALHIPANREQMSVPPTRHRYERSGQLRRGWEVRYRW